MQVQNKTLLNIGSSLSTSTYMVCKNAKKIVEFTFLHTLQIMLYKQLAIIYKWFTSYFNVTYYVNVYLMCECALQFISR